jgi:hypothetical protein
VTLGLPHLYQIVNQVQAQVRITAAGDQLLTVRALLEELRANFNTAQSFRILDEAHHLNTTGARSSQRSPPRVHGDTQRIIGIDGQDLSVSYVAGFSKDEIVK